MSTNNCSIGIPSSQLSILNSFYIAAGGPNWIYSNISDLPYGLEIELLRFERTLDFSISTGIPWFTDVPANPCADRWAGVVCSESPSLPVGVCVVSGLFLPYHNMVGHVASELAQLTTLEILSLSYNDLQGGLNYIASMNELIFLSLYGNYFSGTIPTSIGQMKNLTTLNLGQNHLSGTIPSQIEVLTNMKQLFLVNNSFHGFIPYGLGNLHQIYSLNFAVNSLEGSIPTSFSGMSSLVNFAAYENRLTGKLPNMSSWSQLEFVRVHENYLTGTLPNYFQHFVNMSEFCVQENFFSGTISSTIGLMPRLELLYLFNNEFTGTLPSEIQLLPSLKYLLAQQNYFRGPLTDLFSANSPSTLLSLSTIDLSDNRFSGSFPNAVIALPNITFISVIQNCFSGSLTNEICQVSPLSNLSTISLSSMSASCEISLGYELTYLSTLMTGTVPACLFGLPKLVSLHLSGNGFTGTLPDAANVMGPNLRTLVLSHNKLGGTIPTVFKEWPFDDWHMSNNRFRGTCDGITIFDNNPNATLHLHNNRLSGLLPRSFYTAKHIEVLEGNLFGCYEWGQMPEHDPKKGDVVCGSSTYDLYLILFTACLLICFIIQRLFLKHAAAASVDNNNLSEPVADTSDPASKDRDTETGSDSISSPSDSSIFNQFSKLKQQKQLPDNLRNRKITVIQLGRLLLGFLASFLSVLDEAVLSIRACYDMGNLSLDLFPDPHFFTVLLMDATRRIFLFLTTMMVIVLSFYILLFKFMDNGVYASITYQYGWTLSLAFIGEEVPAIVLFVLMWFVIVSIVVILLKSKHMLKKHFIRHPFVCHFGYEKHVLSAEQSFTNTGDVFQADWREKWRSIALRFSFLVLLPIFNFAVMVVVNGVYIKQSLNKGDNLIGFQFGLAVFKLIWSNFIIPRLMQHMLKEIYSNGRVNAHRIAIELQTVMLIFNNILAPCVATMFIDSNCFYYAFNPATTETITYEYEMCVTVDAFGGQCFQFEQYPSTVDYQAPYIYTDQCAASVVVYYVPVFVIMYLIVAFILPLKILFGMYLTRLDEENCSTGVMLFRRITNSALLGPLESLRGDQLLGEVSLINGGIHVSNIMVNLVVLCTFGASSPLLAIIIAIATWSYTFQIQSEIGHFFLRIHCDKAINEQTTTLKPGNVFHAPICVAMKVDQSFNFEKDEITCPRHIYILSLFDRNCHSAWRIFRQLEKYVVLLMSLFFSLFIYDMLGEDSERASVVLPIVMLCFPGIVLLLAREITALIARVDPDSEANAARNNRVPTISRQETIEMASQELFNPLRQMSRIMTRSRSTVSNNSNSPRLSTNNNSSNEALEVEMTSM